MPKVQPTPVRRYAILASAVMVLFSPLLAMSYFATKDGAQMLTYASVRAWAKPARSLFEPMLTFASADHVYATYSLLIALVIPALPLAAWAVRRARVPVAGTFERRASWVVAAAWTAFSASLLVVAIALQVKPANASGNSVVNVVFLAGMIPSMVIGALGSAPLGVSLLRHGFLPRTAGVLIVLALPLQIVGTGVLGHNSIGLFPQMIAWTLALSAVMKSTGADVPLRSGSTG